MHYIGEVIESIDRQIERIDCEREALVRLRKMVADEFEAANLRSWKAIDEANDSEIQDAIAPDVPSGHEYDGDADPLLPDSVRRGLVETMSRKTVRRPSGEGRPTGVEEDPSLTWYDQVVGSRDLVFPAGAIVKAVDSGRVVYWTDDQVEWRLIDIEAGEFVPHMVTKVAGGEAENRAVPTTVKRIRIGTRGAPAVDLGDDLYGPADIVEVDGEVDVQDADESGDSDETAVEVDEEVDAPVTGVSPDMIVVDDVVEDGGAVPAGAHNAGGREEDDRDPDEIARREYRKQHGCWPPGSVSRQDAGEAVGVGDREFAGKGAQVRALTDGVLIFRVDGRPNDLRHEVSAGDWIRLGRHPKWIRCLRGRGAGTTVERVEVVVDIPSKTIRPGSTTSKTCKNPNCRNELPTVVVGNRDPEFCSKKCEDWVAKNAAKRNGESDDWREEVAEMETEIADD